MFSNFKKINCMPIVCYCTKAENKLRYSNTLFLPKTKFPLRLLDRKLVERDETIYNVAGFETLYDWQRGHLSEPEFVLHDGPPYANGQPHMGHAINKILKDTILRYEILKGHKVHYIPGWDCHGLPIELKALTNSNETDPTEIRHKARTFAKRTIEDQKRVFQSWGVTAEWKNAYTTYSVDYMKTQLRQFLKLYKKYLIYRDVKPIYWSPSSRTALAEAELEHNEKHKSPSAFIRFEIKSIPKLGPLENKCYAIIWTTTPWTLPSNQAVCYSENLSYSMVKKSNSDEKTTYVIATDTLKELSLTLKTSFDTISVFPGHTLQDAVYEHPVFKNDTCIFVSSSHVSASKGTGLVHCAGAHGPDDFLVALNNKLPIVDLVDDTGCFITKAGPELEGKNVLTNGNSAVLDILKDNVMHLGKIVHSYPYDWRTNQPVIIKASKQWFINTNEIKNRAIELLENVKILPSDRSDIYKANLVKQIQKRPYWCISRQRKWGVPIPVLYNKTTSETIINENTINHQLNLLDTLGPDFWWKSTPDQLLPPNSYSSSDNIEKCEDIMDIWLDSGFSWAKVLDGTKVADMYLEGVDQFTGWFQSSLLTSVALRDKPPFKTIYVHGFAVDENGIKMSKSVGNVVDPVRIMTGIHGKNAYGVDTLRWWVTCHANQDAVANVSRSVLQSSADEVHKIRSALRFALSCLSDYNKTETINREDLLLIDRYILHLLYQFENQVTIYLQDYQFHKISPLLINLLTNPISALYYTAIKDRLYCDQLDSSPRKSAQFVLYHIFETVSQVIAPMLPHLAEELHLHYPLKEGNRTYFTSTHPKAGKEWEDKDVESVFETLLNCKRDVNKLIGASTSDAVVGVVVSKGLSSRIKKVIPFHDLELQLPDIFQTCKTEVLEDGNLIEDYEIKISRTKTKMCPRCRKWNSVKEDVLCIRCDTIVSSLNSKTAAVN